MKPNILGNFLGQARITKLSEEDRLSCEGLITIEECVKALDTFEKGKNPDVFLRSLLKVMNSFTLTKENIHHSLVAYMKMVEVDYECSVLFGRCQKKKKKISGNKIYVSRSRRVTKSRDRTFRVPRTQRFARPS